jgi:predicted HAD superfamily Cof-like phosphohydrolase
MRRLFILSPVSAVQLLALMMMSAAAREIKSNRGRFKRFRAEPVTSRRLSRYDWRRRDADEKNISRMLQRVHQKN